MNRVCPLCNGIYEIKVSCPVCANVMKDKGALVNYLDDYSPYLLDDITSKVDGVPSYKCIHLYKCPHCSSDRRIHIDRIYI